MWTWLNYTFQSFNFRARQGARPFYDLVASIAAEEFGYVELVSATASCSASRQTPFASYPARTRGALRGSSRPRRR